MSEDSDHLLYDQITTLVLAAADGGITRTDLDAASGSLRDVGFSSLAYLALISRLEGSFGVVIDTEQEPDFLYNVRGIADFVRDQRKRE